MQSEDKQAHSTDEHHDLALDLVREASLLSELDHDKIRKERFVNDVIFCPNCKHETGQTVSNYIRYGSVHRTKWQRYYCRQCKHIFSDLTRTFFHRSRNITKWPKFIHLALVDKLPMKQIACELKLHLNTIYAWNKKLLAFFELYLPNKQFQPSNQHNHDYIAFEVMCTNKGRSPINRDNTRIKLLFKITHQPLLSLE